MEVAEDFLVTGVGTPDDCPTFRDGVRPRLTPLFLVHLDGRVPGAPRSARITLPGVGDLDFLRDSDEPVAPSTCEAVKLDESDFITASAMTKEFAVNSDPSTASPSVRGIRSPVYDITSDGIAITSSPSGEPTPKRAVVRPRVEINCSADQYFSEDAIVELLDKFTADNLPSGGDPSFTNSQ